MFAINHADPCICLADLAVISTTQYARGSKCTFQRREQFIRLTHVLNSIHAQTMQSQLNFQCNRYTRYIDVCVYICHRCEKHLKISKLLRACKSNLSQTSSKRWVAARAARVKRLLETERKNTRNNCFNTWAYKVNNRSDKNNICSTRTTIIAATAPCQDHRDQMIKFDLTWLGVRAQATRKDVSARRGKELWQL